MISKRLPFYFLLFTAIILGAATVVEDARGTAFIHDNVYGALWFKVLWGIVALTTLWQLWKQRLWHHVALLTLHISLLLILGGGLTTALTHQSGILHLRQGVPQNTFLDTDQRFQALPFIIRLDSFYVRNYPGTQAPQDYVSEVTVASGKASISMNRILRRDGYRFYQTSFDPDYQGSWLTVAYDPYGTPIAYFGFLLFGLSAIFVLARRQGSFRSLLRQLSASSPILLLFLLFTLCSTPCNASQSLPCISRSTADSLAIQQVIWNDRVCPFNTLATDFVRKIYGSTHCKGYTPEQIVVSWQRYPDVWNRAPLIKIKDTRLQRHLRLQTPYASMTDLFDAQGNYRLQALYASEPDKTSPLCKAIRETDEKAGLIMMLHQGTLIQPLNSQHSTLSSLRIQAELLYNRVPFVTILFIANLTLGLLSFLLFLIFLPSQLSPRPSTLAPRPSTLRSAPCDASRLKNFPLGALRRFMLEELSTLLHPFKYLNLLILLFLYLLRWYVSGHFPLSNGFETMLFVALVMQALGIFLARRQPLLHPFVFLLPGFVLLVAHLGFMNPQITTLMPVLNSPWLSSHVSCIMISYALLTFTFILALLHFATPDSQLSALNSQPSTLDFSHPYGEGRRGASSLTLLSRLLLHPAVLLLGIGIFLGAVWANVSWGTYWSWDPKEVWALITFIIYALPLHPRSLTLFQRPRIYHIYIIFAFFTVIMTYFGVNFLLGGMHSYAN